jgi:hypothetical protein
VDICITFTNGTAGSADYTTTNVSNCTWCYYGNVGVTTTDTIDEPMKLSIALELLATGTIR